MQTRVKDKINKLLSLANDRGAAVNEAETALRQANFLMKKHAITLADIHGSDSLKLTSRIVEQSSNGKTFKNARRWAGIVGLGVGKFCDVLVHWTTVGGHKKLLYRGEESDLEYAASLTSYILRCIESESEYHSGDKSDKNSFRVIMASRLYDRMDELRQHRFDEPESPTESSQHALVFIDEKMKRINEQFGQQQTSKAKPLSATPETHKKATDAANRVNLTHQLTA